MTEITLTQGYTTRVSDEDSDLGSRPWHLRKDATPGLYYAAHTRKISGKYPVLLIHRVIAERMFGPLAPGVQVDHIDGDGLNNVRSNLQLVTQSQNLQKQMRPRPHKTSKYKGVSWYPRYGKWRARLRLDTKEYLLGYFEVEHDAAKAYDAGAIKHFGAFARTNAYLGLL